MSKLFTIISACPDTYSGYGRRSEQLIDALIKLKGEEWDIRILSQRWGNTPFGYLEEHGRYDLINRIIPYIPKPPDIFFQITVPNEFQPIGKWNVGVTALIETTVCDPSWVEGCNRMDLTIVPSQHSKDVLSNSKFEKRDQQGKVIGKVEMIKPIEVLFEGIPLDKFYKIEFE